MEWLIFGGLAGSAYLLNESKNILDEVTKPIYDYVEKEKSDAIAREYELLQQQQITRKRNLKEKYNHVRTQYNLKTKNESKIINDTNNKVYIMYINDYLSLKDTPINWAKLKMSGSLFDGQMMNKNTILLKIIYPNEELDIIEKEKKLYHIVIYDNDYTLYDNINKTLYISEL
jgi:hypothetical protein